MPRTPRDLVVLPTVVMICVVSAVALELTELITRLSRPFEAYEVDDLILGAVLAILAVATILAMRHRRNLVREIERREQVERRFRESEERIRTIADHVPGVVYSYEHHPGRPRRLLYLGAGLGDLLGPATAAEVGDSIDRLFDLVHPDDASAVRAVGRGAVADQSAVECEFRARGDDGRYRWLRAIGRPERLADGGSRWHVVLLDIDESRLSDHVLRLMAERTSSATGESFFPKLAQTISEALDVRHVLVFEHLDKPVTRLRSLSFWSNGRLAENFEIEIAGTPCEALTESASAFVSDDVVRRYPGATMLATLGARSFFGCQLRDSAGVAMGHLAIFDDDPMPDGLDRIPAFPIFAARAAAELERLRGERALRESRAVTDSVLASMPDGVLVVDEAGRIVMCNEVMRRVRDDEVIGMTIEEINAGLTVCGPDGRTPHPPGSWAISRARRGESVVDDLSYVVLHDRDDLGVWFSSNAEPIRDVDGVVRGAVTVFRDVTERVRAERALRDAAAELRLLIEHAPEAIVIFDVDEERFIDCNRNAELLFGLDRAELLRCGPLQFSPPMQPGGTASAEATDRLVADAMAGRAPVFEWTFGIPGRDPVVCDVRFVRLPGDDVRRIRASLTDITARKQAEQELTTRQQQERRLFRELDHRVRNNLAALLALIDLTRGGSGDVASFATAIRSRVETIAHVHDMLSNAGWRAVRLDVLLGRLHPPEAPGRLHLDGTPTLVPPRQATAIAMVLHELLTNSMKHGALGAADGLVELAWTSVPDDDGRRLVLEWNESGGPEIVEASRRGVGTDLIEGFTRSELRGAVELTYPPEGARHRIRFVLDAVAEPDDVPVGERLEGVNA